VGDICDQKFVLPKMGQNSAKSLKTCYPLKSPIMPDFIEIGETTLEKTVTIFYTLQSFGSPGQPLGQRLLVWVVEYINTPLATCKISSRSEISAAKLGRFCCRPSILTKKTYSKRYVFALHAATKNTIFLNTAGVSHSSIVSESANL